MTGLRLLSYLFIAAGVGAIVLIGLNALGLDLTGKKPSIVIAPPTFPSSAEH